MPWLRFKCVSLACLFFLWCVAIHDCMMSRRIRFATVNSSGVPVNFHGKSPLDTEPMAARARVRSGKSEDQKRLDKAQAALGRLEASDKARQQKSQAALSQVQSARKSAGQKKEEQLQAELAWMKAQTSVNNANQRNRFHGRVALGVADQAWAKMRVNEDRLVREGYALSSRIPSRAPSSNTGSTSHGRYQGWMTPQDAKAVKLAMSGAAPVHSTDFQRLKSEGQRAMHAKEAHQHVVREQASRIREEQAQAARVRTVLAQAERRRVASRLSLTSTGQTQAQAQATRNLMERISMQDTYGNGYR